MLKITILQQVQERSQEKHPWFAVVAGALGECVHVVEGTPGEWASKCQRTDSLVTGKVKLPTTLYTLHSKLIPLSISWVEQAREKKADYMKKCH